MKDNFNTDHFKGILFMILASLFFAINDAFVKIAVKDLGADTALFNVVFIRAIITSVLILMLIFFLANLISKKFFMTKDHIQEVFLKF